jgi:hypothetical protein
MLFSRSKRPPLEFTPGLLWGRGSCGASVLNQNGQRHHCYLFVGTSKNILASQSFSFSLRTFSALPLSR